MVWKNTPHKYPADWSQRRREVIARDGGNCQQPGCYSPGNEVDHVVNIANGGTHELENLQLLCSNHHRLKTRQEQLNGVRNFWAGQYHPKEKHPGIIDPPTKRGV